ncbi:hypothetical protein Tcan_00952, partial [Toxocara canis]
MSITCEFEHPLVGLLHHNCYICEQSVKEECNSPNFYQDSFFIRGEGNENKDRERKGVKIQFRSLSSPFGKGWRDLNEVVPSTCPSTTEDLNETRYRLKKY